MRIVADTNTILSGLLWQGPPRQIINRARAGDITLHTSLVLLAELAEVIGRSKFTRRIQSVQLSAAGLVADYQHLAVLVDPQPLAAPTSRDADDDHLRDTATVASTAAHVVEHARRKLKLCLPVQDNQQRILGVRRRFELVGVGKAYPVLSRLPENSGLDRILASDHNFLDGLCVCRPAQRKKEKQAKRQSKFHWTMGMRIQGFSIKGRFLSHGVAVCNSI